MNMNFGLVFAWTVTIFAFAGLTWGLARMILNRRRATAPTASHDLLPFSLDRYRPMERLMADEDLDFLKSQPGYRPEMGARWKRERRLVFRLYLRELKADFARLHRQAREIVAHSGAESSHMLEVLMKQQFTFWKVTTALEFRLALEAAGIGRVDVTPLVQLLDALRVDLAPLTSPLAI